MPNIAVRRLHSQRLVQTPIDSPVDVVTWLGAVQAQEYPETKWSLAHRTTGTTDAVIDQLFNDGAILRTHMMRPTWHFATPDDIRWIQMLTGPRVHAVNAHYYRQLELDEVTLARSAAVLEKALQGGSYLTRAELESALRQAGIEAKGSASLIS